MLIPAKDVPLFREFRDPQTGKLFARLALDRAAHLRCEGSEVLAIDGNGGYWSCGGDYLVEFPQPTDAMISSSRSPATPR